MPLKGGAGKRLLFVRWSVHLHNNDGLKTMLLHSTMEDMTSERITQLLIKKIEHSLFLTNSGQVVGLELDLSFASAWSGYLKSDGHAKSDLFGGKLSSHDNCD